MTEHQIHGNTEGIKASFLQDMAMLYDWPMESDEFAPAEMLTYLARCSVALNREIAVYISRDQDILDIVLGVTDSVPLSQWHLRRNARRLSCVRCIHTHPQSSAVLSAPDLSALRSLMMDAMCAVGTDAEGNVTGVSAAFLGKKEHGTYEILEAPIVSLRRLPHRAWMDQIRLSDELVLQGEENDVTDEAPEKALLISIDNEKSLEELAALAETAGAQVIGSELQKRPKPDNATYIGSGKASALQMTAQSLDADVVIVDDELSGVQTKNLEDILGIKVIDRTTLILDIFAQRAKSNEGKLQVSLAQMKYRSSRLIGQGLVLSRLGGGIGTRGPGESKLEIDRRRIRERITDLRRELDQLQKQRDLRRKSREKNAVPVVALVGYTNTGKSTLLNQITDAGVFVENQLFATLDAVSRKVTLPDGGEFLLVDTVGFISKLPHDLVDAFKSTLEETVLADVLVIVSDATNPDTYAQRQVVEEVLSSLHADTQPRIEVLNKTDLTDEEVVVIPGAVRVSAKTGNGVSALLSAIARVLRSEESIFDVLVPFSDYKMIGELHQRGRVISEAYEDDGTKIRVALKTDALGQLAAKYGEKRFVNISQKMQ